MSRPKKTNSFSPLIEYDLALNCPLIGVDEVGRGALAGPVYAAAVHFDFDNNWPTCARLVNDSKKLKPNLRNQISAELKQFCNFAIGQASCHEINQIGILPSTLLAMQRAISQVVKKQKKEYLLLVDGISQIKNIYLKQKTIKKGDGLSWHIAAASIIAKTARDDLMKELSNLPEYTPFNWHKNVGYGTKAHCEALLVNGATDEHRIKFIGKIIRTA